MAKSKKNLEKPKEKKINLETNLNPTIKTYKRDANPNIFAMPDTQTDADLKKKKEFIKKDEDYNTPVGKSLLQGVVLQRALKVGRYGI